MLHADCPYIYLTLLAFGGRSTHPLVMIVLEILHRVASTHYGTSKVYQKSLSILVGRVRSFCVAATLSGRVFGRFGGQRDPGRMGSLEPSHGVGVG